MRNNRIKSRNAKSLVVSRRNPLLATTVHKEAYVYGMSLLKSKNKTFMKEFNQIFEIINFTQKILGDNYPKIIQQIFNRLMIVFVVMDYLHVDTIYQSTLF